MRLEEILAAEGVPAGKVPDELLGLLVPEAGGDLRRAILLLQFAAESSTPIDLADTASSETENVAVSAVEALRKGDFSGAKARAEALLIDYGLTGEEVVKELARATDRTYNDPRIAVALADADLLLRRGGNEFIQINALLARISREVFS
jgi:replication factor C small subunit